MPFPINQQYIDAAEQELDLTFPTSFKNKMMIENGGELFLSEEDWQIFPFLDESDQKRKMRTSNYIIKENQQARQWLGFPQNAISFAQNSCGNYLIFLPDPIHPKYLADQVYMWAHETGDIFLLTDSFELLIQSSE